MRNKKGHLSLAPVSGLNANFGVELNPTPSLECCAATLETEPENANTIAIGALHMDRTECHMPQDSTILAEPRFTAAAGSSAKI